MYLNFRVIQFTNCKAILILLISIGFHPTVKAQNLVSNPSFEEYYNCPYNFSNSFNDCKEWFSPNQGTPDYMNVCVDTVIPYNTMDVPKNGWGYQYPRTGGAYFGIGCYTTNPGNESYREYIQSRLTAILEKDRYYNVSFYTVLSNNNKLPINNVSAYLSDWPISQANLLNIPVNAQINNHNGYLIDTINWVEIKGIYKAKGNEQYIAIGNFNNDSTTFVDKNTYPGEYFSYYYIDDISITICDVCKDTIVPIIENNLFIPDAFSPNGDGNNDKLFVRGNNIQELYFAIYDRWGEKVFETMDKNIAWDGTYKGNQLSGAVFVYYCKGKYTDGKEFKQKGDVTLVR